MTSWLRRHSLRLWTTLHRDFDSADSSAKRTARAVWALLTAGTWLVVGRTITWVAGASASIVAWLAVLVALAVFSIALVAALAGPGRTRRPALAVLALTVAAVLLVALS